MRIVHLTRSAWPHPGGLEASVEGLARQQVLAGHQVTVAALRGAQGLHHGVQRRLLRRVGPWRYPTARGLASTLAPFDVVHVHGTDGLGDVAVRVHPHVGISTHGGFFHTPRHRRMKAWVLRRWTRRTLAAAGAVWFTSAADRAQLGAATGTVIGDGIDLRELTGRWNPVPGRWVVPGRVDVHKGIDDLLALVHGLRDPPHLRVVGPEARPGLVQALSRQGRGVSLCFTGAVSRERYLAELLAAEVVVFPSRHEGFGIAAAEAMALGVPVVLSDIPAFREHLQGPGVDLRGGDVRGLMHAVGAAAGLRAARRQRVEDYAWPVVAARFESAYARLLARR